MTSHKTKVGKMYICKRNKIGFKLQLSEGAETFEGETGQLHPGHWLIHDNCALHY